MRTTLTKQRRLALAAAASLALLAGCGDDNGSASGTAADGSAATPTSSAADFNDADVAFVAGMKPHHQQAVEMADLVLAAAPSAEVARLAKQIKAAQAPEIEQLDAMLKTFGADGGHNAHNANSAHGGMMTGAQMQELDAAEGPEASRLFLEMMIRHHQGAIDAAKTEIEKGKHGPAKVLAESIARTQAEEIETMRKLLADL